LQEKNITSANQSLYTLSSNIKTGQSQLKSYLYIRAGRFVWAQKKLLIVGGKFTYGQC